MSNRTSNIYSSVIKPTADRLIAVVAFVVLSPLFFAVMLLLLIANRGNPFFLQPRPGKGERIFRIIKFKTMNDKKDEQGNLLPDELRLTEVGKFVRKTSLDELPQLLNVIAGQMSLIGPRPLLVQYLPLYDDVQRRRHEVKPGITGWAQVNGRNAISWKQKFAHDVWYVDNIGLKLDCTIALRTILKVIRKEGVNSDTSVTMELFTGNKASS